MHVATCWALSNLRVNGVLRSQVGAWRPCANKSLIDWWRSTWEAMYTLLISTEDTGKASAFRNLNAHGKQ
eukprot:1161171-Pelagomonas_calceolata.AAC.5